MIVHHFMHIWYSHWEVLCRMEILEIEPVINHVLHKTFHLNIILTHDGYIDLCKSELGDVPNH